MRSIFNVLILNKKNMDFRRGKPPEAGLAGLRRRRAKTGAIIAWQKDFRGYSKVL
jgi:hypothetical protein